MNFLSPDSDLSSNRFAENPLLLPLDDAEFQYICELVYTYCGIYLQDCKKELVRGRLRKRLKQLELDSFKAYCEYLHHTDHTRELIALIDVLSTNLTSFFRENRHFLFLAKELPRILQRKREQGQTRFRLWSAGCSTGQEPYSLAIMLDEAQAFTPPMDVKILASDISPTALQRARLGIYTRDQLQNVSPQRKVSYFLQRQDCYNVLPGLQQRIAFRQFNLNGLWPFRGPFDVIFCRNTMIYFDKKSRLQLVERFHHYLAPGGLLFLGHAEGLQASGIPCSFKYLEPSIYQKDLG